MVCVVERTLNVKECANWGWMQFFVGWGQAGTLPCLCGEPLLPDGQAEHGGAGWGE